MKRRLRIFIIIGLLGSPLLLANNWDKPTYVKEYYDNGQLKAQGWTIKNSKTDYWIFYYPNGQVAQKGHFLENQREDYWYFYNSNGYLIKEGHFIQNRAEDWWIFYEIGEAKKSKIQYKNNQKHGYALRYRNSKLIKAEKFLKDQKMGEWESLREFRRDNPEVSLR